MSRIMIVTHHLRPEALDLAVQAADRLHERGHEVWMPTGEASDTRLRPLAADGDPADTDLVLSLGGDGTVLRAVGLLDGAPVPVLGVNLGRLGYLTEIEADQLEVALDRYLAGSDLGHWHLDERMMLAVSITDPAGRQVGSWRALNEAVVEKRESGRTVSLLVRIDGERFTSYAADGLIVSTPTGSTAYSLSARGPVVSPKHRAILVTPVAPHMLFDRSLVLDPSETVEIEVLEGHAASVVVDGRHVGDLEPRASVRCVPADETARFVRFGAHHYHQVLKVKFGLLDR